MRRHSDDSASSSSEDEELGQLEYGYRRPGRNVNFRHRDSSALTPAQAMERDVYYVAAEEAMERAGMILQIMTLLFMVYQQTGLPAICVTEQHRQRGGPPGEGWK